MTQIRVGRTGLQLFCFTLSVVLGAALALVLEGPPRATAQVSPPSHELCWSGIPRGEAQINTCSADQRLCPSGPRNGYPYCIDISPAERAERERRRQADAAEREARARREQQAREAAERAAAAREAAIRDTTNRLGGSHRRGDAERLINMREAADRARARHLNQPPPAAEEAGSCRSSPTTRIIRAPHLMPEGAREPHVAYINGIASACEGSVSGLQCRSLRVLGNEMWQCQATVSCPGRSIPCGARATAR